MTRLWNPTGSLTRLARIELTGQGSRTRQQVRHPPSDLTDMRVLRRDRLGGLVHEYSLVT